MDDRDKPASKRDTSAKRESILDAAIVVFTDEGFDSASMDRIAEHAGASKRTVYNHFASKDELFQAVIERFAREMRTLTLIPYDPERPLEAQLGDFVDAELAVANTPTWMGFIRVLLTAFLRDPELARGAMSRQWGGEDSLTAWLREATLDGKLVADDPALAARVFSAMLGGAFTWPALYREGLDPLQVPALKAELIETFLSRHRRPGCAVDQKE